ncbi:MAG: hypothetical protein ACD_39C01486G0005 [uncultured bacterium]|nr:MAG: hypothetical protein ACD_39C01486G0005 [uncultured bacterium]
MNVAFDPWIPVVTASGKPELASLHAVLAEGEKYVDLAVRPHERVALMRLLICVAHAALEGPKDYFEWCEVPRKLPEASEKYLKDWKDSFDLFHEEKPWLQVKDLTGEKTSPVALLDFELATGNNSTLFDHGGQLSCRNVEPARLALNLLTFLNFSSGGGAPIAQWQTTKTSQVGNPDAPCLSQSMAHCLLRGKSVAETIHLNLPTYEQVGETYKAFKINKKKEFDYSEIRFGRPVWELFPASPDYGQDRVMNASRTYLGRLVPISRWIRFIHNSDQMFCCNGFKYETYKEGFAAEPTAAVREVKSKDKKGVEVKERRVVKVDPAKALWRELTALFVKRTADGLGGPFAMQNAPHDSEFDFHVCAITRDQASMDIALESVFHITPAFRNHFPQYQTEVIGDAKVIGAEGYSRKLRWAIEDYRNAIDADWKSRVKRTQAKEQNALRDRLAQKAFLAYWTKVEMNLHLLITHIEAVGSDDAVPTRDSWRKMLFTAACEAYAGACGQETPRQLRAYAKGFQKLKAEKDEPESDTTETKEELNEPAS